MSDRPIRALACSVLHQAVIDLSSPLSHHLDRQTAIDFFAGSAMLQFWCAAADVDRAVIVSALSSRIREAQERQGGRVWSGEAA